jgi:hypothetical protein
MPKNIDKVETVKVDYTCDSCSEGKMRPTGMALTSYPMQYPHKCEKCEHEATYDVNYPYIDFV